MYSYIVKGREELEAEVEILRGIADKSDFNFIVYNEQYVYN